jgi:hypothetical protein
MVNKDEYQMLGERSVKLEYDIITWLGCHHRSVFT